MSNINHFARCKYEAYTPISTNYAIPRDGVVSNEQLIIILTGYITQSAAEFMVDMAFNIENTLVIGQNTGGALLSNFGIAARLPRSRMPNNIGNYMFILHENHFREGRGFAPDIWVSGDALTAALGLIHNHFQHTGLTSS